MVSDMEVIEEISAITGVKYSDEQLKILQHRGGMCILACAGSGKALKNGTGVLTPDGYVKIEELRVGDTISSVTGGKQVVEGVFPQGKKDIYKVKFDNDVIIECSGDHLWTYKLDLGEPGNWVTDTTENILNRFEDRLKYRGLAVPMVNEIEFNSETILDIKEKLAIELFNPKSIGLGKEYLFSSIEDRKKILEHAANMCNNIDKHFMIIKVPSANVADDMQFIAESLGYKVFRDIGVSDNFFGVAYSVRISSVSNNSRTIVDIQKTSKKDDMTCIKVSDKSGLFVTEHCVVTHNTTILTHLLAKRIKTGEIPNVNKLLCTTYSKAGSTEMEERLKALLKKLGIAVKVQVKTMHASYYQVLKHFGVINGNVCTNGQRSLFINQAIKESGLQLEDEDSQLVDSLLSFQVNNLLDDASLIKSYVYTLEDVPLEKYSEIRMRYSQKKQEANVIDFDDMQMYMYMLLVHQKSPEVIQFCRNLWEYFFIDEFQDISKIQFEILRVLVTSSEKLMVIGDDDQSIYEWRGANPEIILNICGYYDIQKFVLSTNYRCGEKIVERAAIGIKNNEKRAEKDMKAFNRGGRIKACDSGSSNLYEMSKYAHKYILQLINEKHISPDDIAVLSRNNQHLAILNNMLFRDGIYSNTSAEMKFTGMSMYKDIKAVIEIASNTYNHNIVQKHFWKLCVYLGIKNSSIFSQFMNTTGCCIKDALGYIISNYAGRNREIGWTGKIRIPEKVDDKLSYRYNSIKRETEENLILLYKTFEIEDEVERISAFLHLYLAATEFMHKSGDKSRTANGLVAYIKYLIKEDGIDDAMAFLFATEQYESGKATVLDSKVTMSTMHGAKGREWKYVILFANDNVTFPSFEGINRMIKDGVDTKDISGSIDEDRRLSYVGWTRAKEELVILTDKRDISVYTLEALGLLGKNGYEYNKHIIGMAVDGGVPIEYLDKAEREVFDKDSQYYMDLDINAKRPSFIIEDDTEDDEDNNYDF